MAAETIITGRHAIYYATLLVSKKLSSFFRADRYRLLEAKNLDNDQLKHMEDLEKDGDGKYDLWSVNRKTGTAEVFTDPKGLRTLRKDLAHRGIRFKIRKDNMERYQSTCHSR